MTVPERRKRRIIKDNLINLYADIKRDILCQVISASQKGGRDDLSTDCETIKELLTIDGFKTAFQGGRESYEGFNAFRNYISDEVPEYREIVLNLHILTKQIDYVLHTYTIKDESVFNFFKRLEIFLVRLERMGPGYDEEKTLSRFIWEVFAGWSWVEGYRGYDIIENMLADI